MPAPDRRTGSQRPSAVPRRPGAKPLAPAPPWRVAGRRQLNRPARAARPARPTHSIDHGRLTFPPVAIDEQLRNLVRERLHLLFAFAFAAICRLALLQPGLILLAIKLAHALEALEFARRGRLARRAGLFASVDLVTAIEALEPIELGVGRWD